jgi:spermidine synthase
VNHRRDIDLPTPSSDSPVIFERLQTARGEIALRRVGEHFEMVSNGVFLVDTRDGRSERLLATAALSAHAEPARVLVGGLGVGFTLAAVLADTRVAEVTVVEIEPAVLEWQRSVLSHFSDHALDDPRVSIVVADLVGHLHSTDTGYDVICLDVDNGPDWTVTEANSRLYGADGTVLLRRRLRRGGVLAVWSARAVPEYEDLLRAQFGGVTVHVVSVDRRAADVVYVSCDKAPRSGE